MFQKLSIVFILLFSLLFQSQEIVKIEFEHCNDIIIGKEVNILLEPIKNNRKNKVRVTVKKDEGNEYVLRISKEKFREICSSILKIKNDTIAVNDNLIDGSSSKITLYDNLGHKEIYYATGLDKKSQTNDLQKDFWYASFLILKSARLQMLDLIYYR